MKKSLKFGIVGAGTALFFIILFLGLEYIDAQINFDPQGIGITLLTFPITVPRMILSVGYVILVNPAHGTTDIILRNMEFISYSILTFLYFSLGYLLGKFSEKKLGPHSVRK